MKVDYNAFEGMRVTGEPVSVLSRGEFVVRDREFVGKPGYGQYLHRGRFGAADKPAVKKLPIGGAY
jgi:dihydropyrimidinase